MELTVEQEDDHCEYSQPLKVEEAVEEEPPSLLLHQEEEEVEGAGPRRQCRHSALASRTLSEEGAVHHPAALR